LLALVRDAEDVAVAIRGGLSETLYKPYAREDLERVLRRIGFEGPR
jgi:hypothetical protein